MPPRVFVLFCFFHKKIKFSPFLIQTGKKKNTLYASIPTSVCNVLIFLQRHCGPFPQAHKCTHSMRKTKDKTWQNTGPLKLVSYSTTRPPFSPNMYFHLRGSVKNFCHSIYFPVSVIANYFKKATSGKPFL